VYNQFVIRTQERDQLRDYLHRAGIPTEIYYPVPLHLQPAFRYLGYQSGDFPNAESASRSVLALPILSRVDGRTTTVCGHSHSRFLSRKATIKPNLMDDWRSKWSCTY